MNRFDSTFSSSQRSSAPWLRTVLLAVLFTVGMVSFASAQISINLASGPSGLPLNLNQACEGQQYVYNTENFGSSGQTYTWTVVGGFITAGAGTPSVTVQWQNVGNQTLTVNRNSFGTNNTASINVAVSRMPTPAIAGPNVVCINSERTYSTLGVAGSNYTWNVSPSSMVAVIGGVPLGVASGSNQVNLRWINTGTATVTVTETAVGGVCRVTTSSTVIVNPIPSPTITSSTGFGSNNLRRPGLVVAGTSHTYSVGATPGNVFQWTVTGGSIISGTATSPTITVQWSNAGTGTVRCRETVPGSDCSTEKLDTVFVRPVPTPSVTGSTSPCGGSTQTYSTTNVAGNSYSWSVPVGGVILSGQGTNSINVAWSGPTWPNVISTSVSVVESVNEVSAGSPVGNSSTSVFVKPIPPVTSIGGNSVVCATNMNNSPATDNTVSYTCSVPANTGTGTTGSGTVTPFWTVNGGTIITGQGTTTITVRWNNNTSAPVIGSVACTHTSTFGCASTSNVSVTVNPLTTPSVTGLNAICVQSATDYSTPSVPGSIYSWAVSGNGVIVSGQGTNKIRVRWIGTGASSVTVTKTNPTFNCPVSNTLNVAVNPLPTATLTVSGKTAFCDGGDITICAPLGFDKYVWNTGETARCIVARTSGQYWCMVTNGNGCTNVSDTVRLNVTTVPGPSVAISGPTTFCEGGNVTLTAPAGFSSYSWKSDDASFSANTQSVTVSKGGLYRVTVADAVSGCTGTSAEVDVVVNPSPKPELSVTGSVNFCAGDSVVVTAPSGYVSYTWVSTSGNSYGNTNRIVIKATDTVTCQVVDVFGCAGASVALGVKTPPVVKPLVVSSGPTTFCDGSAVKLTAEEGFTSYLWSNGSTEREITVTNPGEYFVTVSDKSSKCPAQSASVNVVVNDFPVKPIINRVGDVLTATSSSDVQAWVWNVDGKRIQNAVYNTYTVTAPGTYTATAIRNGCESTSEEFKIMFTSVNEDVVAGAQFFSVYPNPTSGRVNIATGLSLVGDVRINVTNAVGVDVMSVNEVGTGAGFTTTLDMTTLPAGLYNVVINNGAERWVVRLVRQ